MHNVIKSAAREAGVLLVAADEALSTAKSDSIFAEILRADLVIAVLSNLSSNVLYEVGFAHAAGKLVIFLVEEDAQFPAFAAQSAQSIIFERSSEGLRKLQATIRKVFIDFRRDPSRLQTYSRHPSRPAGLPLVHLDRLEPREFENLCFELLTQMGYRRVEWGKQLEEIDAVATLPKKDPDGFEYQELWLISMGRHAPSEMLLEMVAREPDYLLRQLRRPGFRERFGATFNPDAPVTLLLILLRDSPHMEMLQQELRRTEQRLAERRSPYNLRLRIWDRQQMVSLVQQYPQIAHKYFSEEGRAQSKSRKSYEQLYLENTSLNEKMQVTISALREERDKRVRAEREAVWKDVAFTAAHKLGNPIFALETNLQGMKRKIATRPAEALEVAAEMDVSIEKAKTIIDQFKSLTKAQQISTRAVELLPLIKNASRIAENHGVHVQVTADKTCPAAQADPIRMTECFDELFANALHWLNKSEKRIAVTVGVPKKQELPSTLNERGKYIRVRFEDNGCGVPSSKKEEIFAPFFTTYPHGTGLGLSLVQRIVEGHGGAVREVGKPEEGAAFEIFVPQATSKQ